MRNKCFRQFRPTPRDKILFKYLFEHKVAIRRQVALDVFGGATKQTVNMRLSKLVLHKYLDTDAIILSRKATHTYSLGEKGFQELVDDYKYRIANYKGKSDSVQHDLVLVDIMHVLKQKKIVKELYTENMLRGCIELRESKEFTAFSRLKSDGAMKIIGEKGLYNIALEYDVNPKSRERYQKKLLAYYLNRSIQGIIYICNNMQIISLLQSIDNEICKQGYYPKFYYGLIEKLISGKPELTFSNIKSDIFHLK